jgi:hypothetical protein
MKSIIIKFGSIAGILISGFMFVSAYLLYFYPKSFEPNMWLGFGGMFLGFIFVFIGIKKYRDTTANGYLKFGKAFKIGFLMTLLASCFYVITWMIVLHTLMPDFITKYAEHTLANTPAAELASQKEEMNSYIEWYKNPILVILLTFLEVLPFGILFTVLSSLILMKKKK